MWRCRHRSRGASASSGWGEWRYTLEKEQKEAALAKNPNYIKYLYVDKLSDKISVIVSDQNTIMDLKGILGERGR